HTTLGEQSYSARGFQHTLNDKHHVGTARIIFIETQRDVVLVCPWQDAISELSHLHAVANDDGVLANQVDAADMAVEIHAYTRPVETSGHLLDMGRFAGTVIARDNDAAIVR